MELNPLLRRAVQLGASDIHLKVGQPPILRRDGALSPMEGSKPLQDSDLEVGLAIVTGATGSGKTTTLAAMIDFLNRSRQQHIVTIEDPIEIIHPDHSCIV